MNNKSKTTFYLKVEVTDPNLASNERYANELKDKVVWALAMDEDVIVKVVSTTTSSS